MLGILNYNRDKSNVQIVLNWDMQPYGFTVNNFGVNTYWGVISITNIGCRPIFVSHAFLELSSKEIALISDAISGVKLLEGDPPKIYPVTQEGLDKYAQQWQKLELLLLIVRVKNIIQIG